MREHQNCKKHSSEEQHHCKKYQADEPYPELSIECKNVYYARILQEDYAGLVSELTAITLYSYQHFTEDEENTKFAETIRGISIVEMKHLELLGEAILELGGNPKFVGYKGKFWNGSYVEYAKDIGKILLVNIKAEEDAIKQYTKHILLVHDESIQKLLKRIILDEECHLAIFKKLLESY